MLPLRPVADGGDAFPGKTCDTCASRGCLVCKDERDAAPFGEVCDLGKQTTMIKTVAGRVILFALVVASAGFAMSFK